MKKKKKNRFNKTEESIFTLLSLYVLSKQAFESLTKDEDILSSDFDEKHTSFRDLVNDTIHEALVYQILLKSCAFLDEWNKIFGVHTEDIDKEKILRVKQIAKPAFKCISQWKNLRDFRNEAIAHNHRNKEGRNIYLNYLPYNSPQTNAEIYLLVFCLKKMIDVVNYFFADMVQYLVLNKLKFNTLKSDKLIPNSTIKKSIKEIDEEITNSLMRIHILSSLQRGISDK